MKILIAIALVTLGCKEQGTQPGSGNPQAASEQRSGGMTPDNNSAKHQPGYAPRVSDAPLPIDLGQRDKK